MRQKSMALALLESAHRSQRGRCARCAASLADRPFTPLRDRSRALRLVCFPSCEAPRIASRATALTAAQLDSAVTELEAAHPEYVVRGPRTVSRRGRGRPRVAAHGRYLTMRARARRALGMDASARSIALFLGMNPRTVQRYEAELAEA